MDQPGVYFTLNAPFVKFIGLYSNTSEGGTQGVIANAQVGNAQLDFLQQQLAAAKAERASGQGRALVIATHHPPFTGSPSHVPSPDMLTQIDQACTTAGIWPDLYLSGHAHLYERYTRTVNGKQIPYVVAGMGGYYNLPGLKAGTKPPAPATPASGTDASGNPLTIQVYNDNTFGFLRMTVSSASITGEFISVDPATHKTGVADSFTLDLKANTVSNGPAAKSSVSASTAKPSAPASTATATGSVRPVKGNAKVLGRANPKASGATSTKSAVASAPVKSSAKTVSAKVKPKVTTKVKAAKASKKPVAKPRAR
jgi:hypothetical protein